MDSLQFETRAAQGNQKMNAKIGVNKRCCSLNCGPRGHQLLESIHREKVLVTWSGPPPFDFREIEERGGSDTFPRGRKEHNIHLNAALSIQIGGKTTLCSTREIKNCGAEAGFVPKGNTNQTGTPALNMRFSLTASPPPTTVRTSNSPSCLPSTHSPSKVCSRVCGGSPAVRRCTRTP